jgi:hypothetical protein
LVLPFADSRHSSETRTAPSPSTESVVTGGLACAQTKPAGTSAARAVVLSLADIRARIQSKSLAGLQTVSLEVHLNDDDFKAALGCTRDEWALVPAWKKEVTRKKAGLF